MFAWVYAYEMTCGRDGEGGGGGWVKVGMERFCQEEE